MSNLWILRWVAIGVFLLIPSRVLENLSRSKRILGNSVSEEKGSIAFEYVKFRRAQDLESQRCKSNQGLEETLEAVLDMYFKNKIQ